MEALFLTSIKLKSSGMAGKAEGNEAFEEFCFGLFNCGPGSSTGAGVSIGLFSKGSTKATSE